MKIEVLGNGYVTDEVSTVKPYEANLNEENRIKFVTDLAAISRGKHESNNPAKRYQMLLKEAAPNIENKLSRKCPKCGSARYIITTNYDDMLVIGTKESVYVDTTIACNDCRYNENHYDITNIWIEPTSDLTGTPSRPLEFLPVLLKGNISYTNPFKLDIVSESGNFITMPGEEFINKLSKFGYIVFNEEPNLVTAFKLYTNMRACLNAGIAYEDIPYNTSEELQDFRAIRIKAPMFVFNHLVTHTALSKEARSERVTELVNTDYWLPEDFRDKVYKYLESYQVNSSDITDIEIENTVETLYSSDRVKVAKVINNIKIAKNILSFANYDDLIEFLISYDKCILNMSQHSIQMFFKDIGYPKEIYQRAMLEFRYKEFIMTGWRNDSNTFKHLCIERNSRPNIWKNWTQIQTTEVVNAIDRIVFPESTLSE